LVSNYIGELTDSDKQLFVAYYQMCAVSSEVGCRRFCAFNFPAIVSVLKPQNFGLYKLEKVLKIFVTDEDLQVQQTMASCFHEISSMLGPSSFKILSESLSVLLESDEEMILQGIYGHLGDILTSFSTSDPTPKMVIVFRSYSSNHIWKEY
jgi:serine/threonine-protein phosphatase 4 regulatory subunit 4